MFEDELFVRGLRCFPSIRLMMRDAITKIEIIKPQVSSNGEMCYSVGMDGSLR